MNPHTAVSIDGDRFRINGSLTYDDAPADVRGRLYNVRAANGAFDDENPDTVERWVYPDTGTWDPDRNVAELCAAVPTWYEHGVRAIGVNLQGGRPVLNRHEGGTDPAATRQPWIVSAYTPTGELQSAWRNRVERLLHRTDEIGMVLILGMFYQGQDGHLADEDAVVSGVDAVLAWLDDLGATNVILEVNNECDTGYDHDILGPDRVHELIRRVRKADGPPVGTSFRGGAMPTDAVVDASDVIFLHGNGVDDPHRIRDMVETVHTGSTYRGQPIVFNEDDVAMLHDESDGYGFGIEPTHVTAATAAGASWGYYDKGTNDYESGFQSPPINWELSTPRKRAFFTHLAAVTAPRR